MFNDLWNAFKIKFLKNKNRDNGPSKTLDHQIYIL